MRSSALIVLIFFPGHPLPCALADFGLALNASEERAVTRLGTLDYMAPEVLRCPDKYLPEDNKMRADLAYNEGVDCWAMGILAYELIVGRPPFGMVRCVGACLRYVVHHLALPDLLCMAVSHSNIPHTVPPHQADRDGTMRAITQLQPSMPDWVSPGAASFVLMALDKTAATRAPIARLIQHPWIQMYTRTSSQG